MRQLSFAFLVLFLAGCTAPAPDTTPKIRLQVSRAGLLGLLGVDSTYLVSADGSGATMADLPPDLGDAPRWSPDGEWIAFYNRAFGSGRGSLYLMRFDGRDRREIRLPQQDAREPTWSPDSMSLAYTDYALDYDHNVFSSRIRVIGVACYRRGEDCQPESRVLTEGHLPDWSPDGQRIVYTHVTDPYSIHVLSISVDGTSPPVDLTPHLKECFDPPRWSPNGEKIVFSCDDAIYTPNDDAIYTINADGSGLTMLTQPGDTPTWSPDGKQIAFVSTRDGLGKCLISYYGTDGGGCEDSEALFLMNQDGSHVIRLSQRNDEVVDEYTWLPTKQTHTRR